MDENQADYHSVLLAVTDSLRHAIEVIDKQSLQVAVVVDAEGRLEGMITDGDIRRAILRGVGLDEPVSGVMNAHPRSAPAGASPEELRALMASRSIKHIPLLDPQGRVVGLHRVDDFLPMPTPKDNPVIILAGGLGTRLRPLTENTPKPLLKVGGKPLLELILDHLRSYGFHRIYIAVNYLAAYIEEYLGDGKNHGVTITYLHEPDPLGTAGPISMLPEPLNLPCIVVNGDLLTNVNFEHMLRFHNRGGHHLTVGVKEYPLQIPYGVVETEGERIVDFREKPSETRLINAGVYVLSPEVVRLVPPETNYNMDQLIKTSISENAYSAGAFLIHDYWLDIGSVDDYQKAQQDFQDHFKT